MRRTLMLGLGLLLPARAVVACGERYGEEPTPLPERPPEVDGGVSDGSVVTPDAGSDGETIRDGGSADSGGLKRTVFTTSSKYLGNLNGIAGADTLCAQAAGKAKVPRVKAGKFRAWISTNNITATERFVHDARPFVTPNDTLVAKDWSEFAGGPHLALIGVDENGEGGPGTTRIWTGTAANGALAGPTCADWTKSDALTNGTYGLPSSSGVGLWSMAGEAMCDEPYAVLCVEE